MTHYHIEGIKDNIMKTVDFERDELYLTIKGRCYTNIYGGKKGKPRWGNTEAKNKNTEVKTIQ